MEASEYFSEPAPVPNQFDVRAEQTPRPYLPLPDGRWMPGINFSPTEYFISLNGEQLGLLHCEVTQDGQEAFLDGIDIDDGARLAEADLTESDWQSIALCVHGLTKARRVTHPAGQTPFLESV